jgi:uncharacterized protein (DUF1501 family)
MFGIGSVAARQCNGLHRRDFLTLGALSGLGLALPQALAARRSKDVNCILIWTLGGTSHHDTLDPKPEATAAVRGEFGPIRTAIPGVQFTDVCPTLARELKRFALLRSWNPKNGSHGAADQYVLSGKPFNPNQVPPCMGSVISHVKGFKSKLPPFVQLGSYVDRTFGGGTSGHLSQEHNPFEMNADPSAANFRVEDISPPQGVTMPRLERRRGMLQTIDALQRQADLQPTAFNALDKHTQAAFEMVTSPETTRAFAIDTEDPRRRDAYGRNRLGQSLLLSRRLIESGARFVTVTDPGWDTHAGQFPALKNHLMPRIDQGLPALLADLEERGLLESTLVVWLTDFGRTPQVNSASGRDHWASAGFAVMAGAGIPGGAVLGKTDEEGGQPTRDEYYSEDLVATIYSKLGVPLDLVTYTADGRPMQLNEGRVIREWM